MTRMTRHDTASQAGGVLPSGFHLHWYEIGEVVGKGGFGITYACRDTNLDHTVAIKEYFPRSFAARDATDTVRPTGKGSEAQYDWGLRRFLDEARTLAKFRHPSIVRVSSVFEANGTAYMVMDYERGRSLAEAVEAGSVSGETSLMAVLLPLLDGLDHVHAAGFIHRDIKPDNILIRDDGSPVLLDFGAARHAVSAENDQLTAVATRGYAPFEQFDGSGDLKQGPWTDIYSLGAVLYEFVSGARPAESLHRATALLEGGRDPLGPLDQAKLPRRYSAELLRAIEHALAFKLADRPRSIAEWRSLYPVLELTAGRGALSPPRPAAAGDPNASERQQVSQEAVTEADPLMFPSLHVMVVDDEPFTLNLVRRVLARLGIERITTASDGQQALADLKDEAAVPDVILCDLNMPGMDGLELLRRLGERGAGCGVILISGEDEKILRTAQRLGRDHHLNVLGFLNKPISPEPLSRLLLDLKHGHTAQTPVLAPRVTEDELDDALRNGGITAVFQPKVSARTREVVGVEALARLHHPQRGSLGPGAFIPLAEDRGRMEELTEAVFRHAAAEVGAWQAAGIDLKLSVNITTDSLRNFTFSERVVDWAASEGLRPSQIILEVTETRVMQDVRSSLETLSRARLKGLGLSIDDFGTGYSSLEQLKQTPFSELKIDRAFVTGAAQDPQARAILESSVSLAKRLGLDAVAEGVETQEDWDLVAAIGCDMAQGYFIAKPMPGEEIPDWIGQWSASS